MIEKGIQHTLSGFSLEIKELVEQGEWDALNEVLTQRQKVLSSFFSQLPKNPQIEELVGIIKNLQNEDADFLQTVQRQKAAIEKEYLSLKQGRKSIAAYQE